MQVCFEVKNRIDLIDDYPFCTGFFDIRRVFLSNVKNKDLTIVLHSTSSMSIMPPMVSLYKSMQKGVPCFRYSAGYSA